MFNNLLSKCSLIIIFVVFLIVIVYKSSNISESFNVDSNNLEEENPNTLDNSETLSEQLSENETVTDNNIQDYLRDVYGNSEEEAQFSEPQFSEAQNEETQFSETQTEETSVLDEQLPRRINTTVEEENPLPVIDAESHLEGPANNLSEDELWLFSEEGQLWLSTLEGMNWLVNTEEGQLFWKLTCELNGIEPIFCDFFAELRKLALDCQNSHPEDPDKCLSKVFDENNCKRIENHCNRYYADNNIDITSRSYQIDENSPMTEQICAISGFLCAWEKFKRSQSEDIKTGQKQDLYKDTIKVVRSFISKASEKVNPPKRDNSHWPAGGFDSNSKKDESLMSKCLGDDILRQREYIISRPVPINADGTCNYHDGQYHLSSNLKLCRACAPGEKIVYQKGDKKLGMCEPCGPDTVSNKRNSKKCYVCPPGTKPNKSRTDCIACEGDDCLTYLPEDNFVRLDKYRDNTAEMQKRINNLTKTHNSDVDKLQAVISRISNTI